MLTLFYINIFTNTGLRDQRPLSWFAKSGGICSEGEAVDHYSRTTVRRKKC